VAPARSQTRMACDSLVFPPQARLSAPILQPIRRHSGFPRTPHPARTDPEPVCQRCGPLTGFRASPVRRGRPIAPPGFSRHRQKKPRWAPGLGAQWLWALLCKASVVHAVFVSEFPRLVEVVVHPTITLLSFGVTCRNRPIPTFRQRSDGSSQTIFNALSRMPTYAVFALEDRSGNESRLAQNLASPGTGSLA
jgi:hypothetical protein